MIENRSRPESETLRFWLSSQMQRGLDSFQCGMLIIPHTYKSPCFFTSFLYDDAARYSCLKPQERTEWLLIPASIWEAVTQKEISPITHTHTQPPRKIHRDPSAETSVTLSVWAVMLKGILIICPTQGETGFKSQICSNYTTSPCSAPTLHSLVFQMNCTAVTAFCKPSNPPKEG